MSSVVRVACGSDWDYVPVGSAECDRLRRLAARGLAAAGPAEVRLHSDAGPLFWTDSGGKAGGSPPSRVLKAMSGQGIEIEPGEKIVMGRGDGAYNEFADLTLVGSPKSRGHGVRLSARGMTNGAIVLTAWPGDEKIIPALARADGPRYRLELAEPVPARSRCFVLDETGRNLVTASMESDGSDEIRVLPPQAVDSWLFAVGSRATREASSRFSMAFDGRTFSVYDSAKGKKYVGALKNDPANQDRWALEQEQLQWLLASRGLGGILPAYELEKS